VECLDGSFLMPVTNPTTAFKQTNTTSYLPIVIILIIAAFVIIFFVFASYKNKQAKLSAERDLIVTQERIIESDPVKKAEAEKGFKEYVLEEDIKPDKDGRYYDRGYGDYITPVIWAAILTNQNKQTTIGNGNSTRISCACACVSCACACACACAGGGAAGCSKKSLHQCQECLKIRMDV
jgi:hypothetical protein